MDMMQGGKKRFFKFMNYSIYIPRFCESSRQRFSFQYQLFEDMHLHTCQELEYIRKGYPDIRTASLLELKALPSER